MRMDKKDTLRNLLISAAIFFTVLWLAPRFLPSPTPVAPQADGRATADRQAVSQASGSDNGQWAEPVAGMASVPTDGKAPRDRYVVAEAPQEKSWSIGSEPINGKEKDQDEEAPESPFRMRLTLSNIGASLETATMTDHAESLGAVDRYRLLNVVDGPGGRRLRSFVVERINIDGAIDIDLGNKLWHCDDVQDYQDADGSAGHEFSCRVDIVRNEQPVLVVRRTYRLPKQGRKDGRHDLYVDLSVENRSEVAHGVRLTYRGGVGVRQLGGRDWRAIDIGVDPGDGRVVGGRTTLTSVGGSGGADLPLFAPSSAEPRSRLRWAASSNIYFTCTVAPKNADGTDNADYIQDVQAFDGNTGNATSDDVSTRFVVGGRAIAPGATVHFPADIYLGKKDFDAFRTTSPYKERNYYYQISQGFGCCTFVWLVEFMIWLLNSLKAVMGDYGVAIIILVLIVRSLLHPITKKGQVNMVRMQKKMQELAPKIEEIKKKYSNDKARMNQEMMKLNINPAGQVLTCLPMFLQMPIWVALYISLSNNILMRHEPFLFTWVRDLTAQDQLIPFSEPWTIPLLGAQITAFNLLPVLLAISMYVQQKLQPKPKPSPNMTDQQKQQQEMMQKMAPMMSIMMFVIFYNMPSGLNLYIMASSIFGAVEQHRIRKHIAEREEAGTLLKPTVKKDGTKLSKPRWLAKLEGMADDARKQQAKRPDRKRKKQR